MMKYVTFFTLLSLSISESNASFLEEFSEKENSCVKTTVIKLLRSFNEILQDSSQNNISTLIAIKEAHNTGHNFGDENKNKKSLYNWLVYSRSLLALHKLGIAEEGKKLQEELERGERYLPMIDFHTDGRDYKYCLSGIWSKVATYDPQERENFLHALSDGKEVPYDSALLQFFRNYNFSYK